MSAALTPSGTDAATDCWTRERKLPHVDLGGLRGAEALRIDWSTIRWTSAAES